MRGRWLLGSALDPKAIDEVRAGEARQLVRDGYEPVKKSRWCLLKRKENLTDHQRIRLRDVLRYNLKSVRAYLLKEDFQQFWDYTSPTWAGKFLVSGAAESCVRGSNR
ncbi:MAG: transposase [Chromatiales bacterium]